MKIILAYSGGLDTAVALHWLRHRYSADVIPFYAEIGQQEDLDKVARAAEAAGADDLLIEDVRDVFLRDFVFEALKANAAYEDSYLMAAPLGRPLIAQRLVEIARREGADAVAHGATGKGNDQVRFYSSIAARDPELRVIAPVMEWEMRSREDEIEYARRHRIPVDASPSRPFSIDTNLWGSSVECGVLDDLEMPPPPETFLMTKSPQEAEDSPVELDIGFEDGLPVSLNGEGLDPVPLVTRLNEIGGRHAVGRVDIVENRLTGIKTRGVYESPAGAVLHTAHRMLEDVVLDRDSLHYKSEVSRRYAELVYYGLWFAPLRRSFQAFVDHTQAGVTGHVRLQLYKGNITALSRRSPFAQYDRDLSTYEAEDAFDGRSGEGFSYIWSMPLRIHALRSRKMASQARRKSPAASTGQRQAHIAGPRK